MKIIFHDTEKEALPHLEELVKSGHNATIIDQERMHTRYAVIYDCKKEVVCLNIKNLTMASIALVAFGIALGMILKLSIL